MVLEVYSNIFFRVGALLSGFMMMVGIIQVFTDSMIYHRGLVMARLI